MDQSQTVIRNYFAKLGLEPELADIYSALHSHGPQTISELSRNSQVERTRIYRLIDRLMETSLIELEATSKRGVIKAAPIANVRILIKRREEELQSLHDELELIEKTLARNSLSNSDSRVQLYHGPEGLRRMFGNELRASGEILSFADRISEEAVGKTYAKKWTEQFESQALQRRLITGHNYPASLRAGKRANLALGYVARGTTLAALQQNSFAADTIFSIYDDTVGYCTWRNGEVYGTEIHNATVATCQRQLFELLWQQAQPATNQAS